MRKNELVDNNVNMCITAAYGSFKASKQCGGLRFGFSHEFINFFGPFSFIGYIKPVKSCIVFDAFENEG